MSFSVLLSTFYFWKNVLTFSFEYYSVVKLWFSSGSFLLYEYLFFFNHLPLLSLELFLFSHSFFYLNLFPLSSFISLKTLSVQEDIVFICICDSSSLVFISKIIFISYLILPSSFHTFLFFSHFLSELSNSGS